MNDFNPQKDQSLEDYVHIRLKSAYAGSKSLINNKALVNARDVFYYEDYLYSPCFYHCINEVVVNAFDNLVKNYGATEEWGGRCTIINVNVDGPKISVYNDGKGIDVVKRKHIDGKKYWNPYLICSQLRTGSNLECTNKVVGGDNGFGLKLPFYHSKTFSISTFDKKQNRSYYQEFKCDMNGDPHVRVTPSDPVFEDVRSGTEFKFELDEEFLNYPNGMTIQNKKHLLGYVRALLILLGFHVKSLGYDVMISFNGKIIDDELKYDAFSSYGNFRIYLGTPMNFSMVNNLVGIIKDESTHIKMVRSYINDKLKLRLSDFCTKNKLPKYNINKLFKNITYTVSTQIPDINPNSQRKEVIEFDTKKFKFEVSDEFLEQVYTKVCDALYIPIKQKFKVERPKFTESKVANPILIITEGKHASLCMDEMLNHLNRKDYSMFEVQGVPINTYKNITYVNGTPVLSKQFVKPNKKTKKVDNRLLQIADILGLTVGQTDFSKLKYKKVIIATDNDEDGKGNIFMMLILFFYKIWPGLFKIPFIGRLETPLIRLTKTKGNKIALDKFEFFSDVEMDDYLSTFGTLSDVKLLVQECYKIDYFKGLGSHTKKQIKEMAKTFNDNIMFYYFRKDSDELLECMWGKTTQGRKVILSNVPKRNRPRVKIIDGMKWVTINNHIRNEVLFYHLLKITRALPAWMDGLTISRRKIIYFALKSVKKRTISVADLAGQIKGKMDYHHGEKSLEGTIIALSQSFKGTDEVHLLEGEGVFGGLKDGVNSDIQARYVKTRLSKQAYLVYPKDDYPLYDYNYGEDKIEPVYMVPIIPMAILSNRHVPGTAWKHKTWARSIKSVLSYVRCKINGEDTFTLWGKMSSPHGVYLGNKKTQEEETAQFTLSKKGIVITELPVGVYITPFEESLPEGAKLTNLTDKKGLKLEVEGLDKDSHLLTAKLDSHFNYIGFNGVTIFRNYEDVLDSWFELRKEYYIKRLKRLIEIVEIMIKKEMSIIRFITEWDTFGLNGESSKQDWDKVLNGFIKVDTSLLKKCRDPQMALKFGDHKYLKTLNVRSIGTKSLELHNKNLKGFNEELEILKKTTWKVIWLKELQDLENSLI